MLYSKHFSTVVNKRVWMLGGEGRGENIEEEEEE